MIFDTLVVGGLDSNCYVLAASTPMGPGGPRGADDPGSAKPLRRAEQRGPGVPPTRRNALGDPALVIDPGGEASRIIEHLEAKNLQAASLVNTHGHADHIAANAELRKRYPNMKIAIGRTDAKALTSPVRNMSIFVARIVKSPPADRLLDDGDVVEFGRWRFRVLATPGHTPGGICLFSDDLDGRPVLFSGDTLFADAVGRTDIPGGNWDDLMRSIREKVFVLPGETEVYPGHGPSTTVAHEKKFNPDLGRGEEAD